MKRVICGAGKYGKRLKRYFEMCGVSVDYFVQTTVSERNDIDGIPIISLDDMLSLSGGVIVCIAIKSLVVSNEICEIIRNKSTKSVIVNYSGFIEENYRGFYSLASSAGMKKCIICGKQIPSFIPSGEKEGLFGQHHVIGGGYRRQCVCPICESGDRERWLFYILSNYIGLRTIKGSILHFAPEGSVKQELSGLPAVDYYSADIVPHRAMHVVDITNIQFRDGFFDYVICNHVMEHILDEEKAVSEIKRVLKDDGIWIFSFPICTDYDVTYEDKSIKEPNDRLREYGQEDHVRLYGNDYKERFESYGFDLVIYRPMDKLSDEMIEKYGFIRDDVIIFAKKRGK